MKHYSLFIIVLLSMLGIACSKTKVVETPKVDVPYATRADLSEFSADSTIVDYVFARKMAFVDMTINNTFEEQGWSGCTISNEPIIIYGFDNKPQYYDFTILDASNTPRGAISVHARKTSDMQIALFSKDITQRNGATTRLGADNAIFVDRSGARYIVNRNQTRSTTFSGKNVQTGEVVNGLEYMTDDQMLEHMKVNVLPQVCSDEASITKAAAAMTGRVDEAERVADLFWNMVAENKEAIIAFQGINDATEGLNKMFKNIPEEQVVRPEEERPSMAGIGVATENPESRVARRRLTHSQSGQFTWLNEIHAKSQTYSTGGGCGHWVCAFLVGAYGYKDLSPQDVFDNVPMTMGMENWGAMTITAADRVLKKYSYNYLGLSSTERSQWDSYWYIIQDNIATYRLTQAEGQLHWTLLYGCYRVKRGSSTNYYFLQIDNGSMVGAERKTRQPDNAAYYISTGPFDLLYRIVD